MSIQWSEEHSVNVKEIDDQHKKFIEILNEFYDAITKGSGRGELDKLLDKITEYASWHFSTEEGYFDEFKYEGSEEHKKEHQKIKDRISAFKHKKGTNEIEYYSDLIDFLEEWLVDHLDVMDKKYIECFNGHGLY